MKVLVACEFSGVVREAFRRRGHDAWSCDLLPSENGNRFHLQVDARWAISTRFEWDLLIAFPPCQYLSKAGGRWWKHRQVEQGAALAFVQRLMDAPVLRIAIENPIGRISTAIRKPDQMIHPYQFGDPWMKQTCLWLKNLPLLIPTNAVEPEGNWVKPGNKRPWRRFDGVREGGGGNAKDRSRTFPGIADAMAEQWEKDED